MLIGVSFLAISLSILAYFHPPSSWTVWPFANHPQPKLVRGSPSTEPNMGDHEPQPRAERNESTGKHTPNPSPGQSKEDAETESIEQQVPHISSPQTTPKARSSDATNGLAIPSFSLNEDDSSEEEENMPPPSFPAMNSAQRASAPKLSAMGPPSLPTTSRSGPTPSQLMPPPRIVPANLRALPINSSSLRVPSRGPLPNRGPPTSNSLGLPSTTTSIKTPNARGKVLLAPGHSPLDWAHLQKSGKNLSGVSSLIRVTPSQLKQNNGRKGRPAWSSYQGKVYNITPYLPFHPGGEGELRRAAGKDGGKLFMEVHPWVNWDNMLGECVVGIMVAENEGQVPPMSTLEDMD